MLLIPASKAFGAKGLLITNPPHGDRLGDGLALLPLYQEIGEKLKVDYAGWQAAILIENSLLAKALRLSASKEYVIYNGPNRCTLSLYVLKEEQKTRDNTALIRSEQANMLLNRIKKNYNHLKKWAARNQIFGFRVYDQDLPEYAFAIDLYNNYAVIQEYRAPASISENKVDKRRLDMYQVAPIALKYTGNKHYT